MTAPASSSICTNGALASAGLKQRAAIPILLSYPAMLNVSLVETGRPWRGPYNRPVD